MTSRPACPCPDGDACHYEGPNPWPAPGADLPGLTAVYLQPASDGVEACLIAEFDPPGPKAFARLWLNPRRLEWGWSLHPTAVAVWRAGPAEPYPGC